MSRAALLLTALLPALLATGSCTAPGESGGNTLHRKAEGALGPYSGSVEAGELLFVSGKIGERGGSFAHEAETSIDAVEAELARAGLDLGDVVSATVYLTDMDRYDELNGIYAQRFPTPHPARACVAVAELPAGARVEIQVVARR